MKTRMTLLLTLILLVAVAVSARAQDTPFDDSGYPIGSGYPIEQPPATSCEDYLWLGVTPEDCKDYNNPDAVAEPAPVEDAAPDPVIIPLPIVSAPDKPVTDPLEPVLKPGMPVLKPYEMRIDVIMGREMR